MACELGPGIEAYKVFPRNHSSISCHFWTPGEEEPHPEPWDGWLGEIKGGQEELLPKNPPCSTLQGLHLQITGSRLPHTPLPGEAPPAQGSAPSGSLHSRKNQFLLSKPRSSFVKSFLVGHSRPPFFLDVYLSTPWGPRAITLYLKGREFHPVIYRDYFELSRGGGVGGGGGGFFPLISCLSRAPGARGVFVDRRLTPRPQATHHPTPPALVPSLACVLLPECWGPRDK